jgi:hypothetical protein
MASEAHSVHQNHTCSVLGMAVKGELIINQGLCSEENQETLTQLEEAIESGFDGCVVTRNGTYATKKIYP